MKKKAGRLTKYVKSTSQKNWEISSAQHLLKRFKEDGSMIRRTSSGRPITATTDENNELVEELICSQEDFLGTQQATREIARNVGITRSSVRRLVKRRKINQFKRMTTLHMNNGTRDWRRIRSRNFAERFDRNPRLVEKFAYQDEKVFTLEVPKNI